MTLCGTQTYGQAYGPFKAVFLTPGVCLQVPSVHCPAAILCLCTPDPEHQALPELDQVCGMGRESVQDKRFPGAGLKST